MRAVNLVALVGAAVALAACKTTDLTFNRLEVAPPQAAPGDEIEIVSEVRNAGDKAAQLPIAVDVELFASGGVGPPIAPLTSWRRIEGGPLQSGDTHEDKAKVRVPANLSPGPFAVCAVVDPENILRERYEDNNYRCAPLTMLATPPRRADLVIEKITAVGPERASLKVVVKIRNAGVASVSGPFKIKAFRRNPRAPLLLTECSLTEGQLASGSPSGCPDLTFSGALAVDATAEIVGYFNYVVGSSGAFPVQPVGPGVARPPEKRAVDFMVDGCYPPQDGSEVWCRINEIDEINNFKGATLTVR